MAEKNVTPAERLEILLPWLNSDVDDPREVVEALGRFLRGTREARASRAWETGGSTWLVALERDQERLTPRKLENLRTELRRLAEGHQVSRTLPLRFSVERARLLEGDRVKSRGRLLVFGRPRDLVVYTFLQALAEPGVPGLSRCPAPAPGDWSRTCGRYFIAGGRVGRPAKYCSDRCRVRAWRVQESDYGGEP